MAQAERGAPCEVRAAGGGWAHDEGYAPSHSTSTRDVYRATYGNRVGHGSDWGREPHTGGWAIMRHAFRAVFPRRPRRMFGYALLMTTGLSSPADASPSHSTTPPSTGCFGPTSSCMGWSTTRPLLDLRHSAATYEPSDGEPIAVVILGHCFSSKKVNAVVNVSRADAGAPCHSPSRVRGQASDVRLRSFARTFGSQRIREGEHHG